MPESVVAHGKQPGSATPLLEKNVDTFGMLPVLAHFAPTPRCTSPSDRVVQIESLILTIASMSATPANAQHARQPSWSRTLVIQFRPHRFRQSIDAAAPAAGGTRASRISPRPTRRSAPRGKCSSSASSVTRPRSARLTASAGLPPTPSAARRLTVGTSRARGKPSGRPPSVRGTTLRFPSALGSRLPSQPLAVDHGSQFAQRQAHLRTGDLFHGPCSGGQQQRSRPCHGPLNGRNTTDADVRRDPKLCMGPTRSLLGLCRGRLRLEFRRRVWRARGGVAPSRSGTQVRSMRSAVR